QRDRDMERSYFPPSGFNRPADLRGGQRFQPQRFAPGARYEPQRFSAPTRFMPQPYAPQRFAPPPRYGQPPYRSDPAPSPAGRWRDQEEFVRRGVREGQLAPLGQVIGAIRQLNPGRQLDAGLEYMGPRLVYRVRWMTANGRRVDYFVDAASGAIISGR
ncbi:MAG TPA: PepSY domain-containing protein, partial [Caulobacteraceae bacterium]